MKAFFILTIIIIFGLAGIFLIQHPKDGAENIPEELVVEKENKIEIEAVQEYIPKLILSAEVLEQSDTLFLRASEKPTSIFFNGELVDFFRLPATEEWFSFISISVKAKPGIYFLQVNFPKGDFVKKNIVVKERSFPTTELVITKELEERGYNTESVTQNIKIENELIAEATTPYISEPYFSAPFLYPLSEIQIVGAYGNIREDENVKLQHLGVDLGADKGTKVYAVNNGLVVFAKDLNNYGKTLIISHGFGVYSLYLHLDAFFVKEQNRVKRGEGIALSGNTGYSISPHLHFSVKVKGSSVDPLRFIKATDFLVNYR